MSRVTLGFGSLLIALCALLVSRPVWASDPFDKGMKDELELTSTGLLCLLCHESLIGGLNTVNKPFGMSARRLGLEKTDVEKLKQVLRQMEASRVDSDCDGVGDIAEIRSGSDPNSGETDAACATAMEAPRYGCHCRLATPSTQRAAWSGAPLCSAGLFALLFVMSLSRRTARKSRAVDLHTSSLSDTVRSASG